MKTPLLKLTLLLIGLAASTAGNAQNEPAAPTNFTATPDAVNGNITLTWNDNSNNEDRFVILKEWSTEEDHNIQINVASNLTSYTDTEIEPNVWYSYTLWAENDFGASSDVAVNGFLSIQTPPAPGNITASTGPMTSVQVTFVDNSNLETGFEIEHSLTPDFYPEYQNEYTTGGSLNNVITYLINDGPFSDFDGPHYYAPNSRIYVRVRAFSLYHGHRVFGPYTPVVSAKTHGLPALPSDFSAHISGDSVIITWTNNADNAAALIMGIYEDEFNPNFASIFKLSANTNSYYHSGADPHIAYHYRLAPIDAYEHEMARDDFWDYFISVPSRYVETTLQPISYVLIAPVITEIVATTPYGVRIKFNEPNDAPNHYYIAQYATNPDGPFDEEWFGGGQLGDEITFESSTGYDPNTPVYIKVVPVILDDQGDVSYYGPASELASINTLPGWPPAAANFTATAEGAHIKLTWTDNSPSGDPLDEKEWYISRQGSGGGNQNHGFTVPANTTEFIDYNVLPNVIYNYDIEAVNEFGNGYEIVSDTALIQQTITAPIARLASYVTPTSFTANWKPTPGADHYEVDVYTINTSTYLLQGVVVHDTLLAVSNTKSYRRYSYVVRAIGSAESPNSNTILVTKIKNLILNPRCSDDPNVSRRWEVINNNIVPVEAWWHVNNTNQYGSLIAQPGSTFFFTQTIPGVGKTSLTHYDDNYVLHTSEKGSSIKQCTDLVAREITEEEIVTEASPITVQAYPNPVTDKFTIKVNSIKEGQLDIRIVNLQGKEVYSTKATAQSTLEVDARGFSRGIYLIRAVHPNATRTIKVLKE